MKKEKRKEKERGAIKAIVSFLAVLLVVLSASSLFSFVLAADPTGPDSVSYGTNETKTANSAAMVNISGGRILTMNLNATIQNPRWKAFVGNVTGKFTLDDSSGSTIFDWTLSSLTGRVYATRNSSTVSWANINCSNVTTLEQENINMNHSNVDDNITKTFNTTSGATHRAFYVGSTYFPANSCPTLNVYRNNASNDNYWEEMALYDTHNIVYASIIEDDQVGFDGQTYDFQMIVPENGLPSFNGATAYYIYLEIGT